ncbi:uncharacterized protein VTP21DRAFT_3446 [Calcarisporiella thermophila]|uniref:uncharacterized protein n=1 Tax=Calcarisporiella thermophila TaxID=911321 RepID=UPI0037420F01
MNGLECQWRMCAGFLSRHYHGRERVKGLLFLVGQSIWIKSPFLKDPLPQGKYPLFRTQRVSVTTMATSETSMKEAPSDLMAGDFISQVAPVIEELDQQLRQLVEEQELLLAKVSHIDVNDISHLESTFSKIPFYTSKLQSYRSQMQNIIQRSAQLKRRARALKEQRMQQLEAIRDGMEKEKERDVLVAAKVVQQKAPVLVKKRPKKKPETEKKGKSREN